MKISLQELATAPEAKICFDYTIDLRKEEVNFGFPFQEPVHIYGAVSDKAGVISLDATVHADVFTNCARCNKPVRYEKEVNISFILAKTIENEQADDIIVVETDSVELDEIVVPELLLDMEMAVLCKEDCKGLCPKCGQDLNAGDCGCVKKEVDPRLAKLAQWLEENKE